MPSASLTAQLTKTTRNKKHLQWIKTKRVRLWLTLKHRKVSDLRIYIGCCHGQGRHGVQIRPPETTERNSADLTTENNITSSHCRESKEVSESSPVTLIDTHRWDRVGCGEKASPRQQSGDGIGWGEQRQSFGFVRNHACRTERARSDDETGSSTT